MDPKFLALSASELPSKPWKAAAPPPAADGWFWAFVVSVSVTALFGLAYIAQGALVSGPPSIWLLLVPAAGWVFVGWSSAKTAPAAIGFVVFVLVVLAGCFAFVHTPAAMAFLRGQVSPAVYAAAAALLVIVIILTLVFAKLGQRSAAAAKESLAVERQRTADTRKTIRELVLAAERDRARLDGRTPEEDGRANPRRYLERAEVIEQTYLDQRNLIGTPEKRAAVTGFILQHMPGDVDVAQTPEQIEPLLKFYWEADHRALIIAREVPEFETLPPTETLAEKIRRRVSQMHDINKVKQEAYAEIEANLAKRNLSESQLYIERKKECIFVDQLIADTLREQHD